MNIHQTINKAAKILIKNKIKTPYLDSELLLSKVISKDRGYIILNLKETISKKYLYEFYHLIQRRKKGEPVAYLINYKDFWKQKYFVNKDVLIPRPDTEVLIEQTLQMFGKDKRLRILDIGTGSGCLVLSILKERKNFIGVGIDISKKALKVANFNAKLQHLKIGLNFIIQILTNFFLVNMI